jgi:uncharacterized Zn-binding protein involved in type VI secretion
MQPQARWGDQSVVPTDSHGKMCCEHGCAGPATTGSPDVYVNNLPALRVTDTGIHGTCCGSNTWVALKGSLVVTINNLPAHRKFDVDQHCGGKGFMLEASKDVYVGDCTETGLAQAQQNTQATVAVPDQPDLNVTGQLADTQPVGLQATQYTLDNPPPPMTSVQAEAMSAPSESVQGNVVGSSPPVAPETSGLDFSGAAPVDSSTLDNSGLPPGESGF